jgi:hypothetical protein
MSLANIATPPTLSYVPNLLFAAVVNGAERICEIQLSFDLRG